MALVAASLAAAGAAAASGVALGAACSMQQMLMMHKRDRRQDEDSNSKNSPRGQHRKHHEYHGHDEASSVHSLSLHGSQRRGFRPVPSQDKSLASFDPETGFSMEDQNQLCAQEHAMAVARTPFEVLANLQRGNTRFYTGQASAPVKSAFERRSLLGKQFPVAAILGCSDSRVPIEIVFDQGLGDLFVVRVAGSCLDVATKASLQYAVNHLKVKVVVLMGHEGCGCIKNAASLTDAQIDERPEALRHTLHFIKKGLDFDSLSRCRDCRAKDRESVVAHMASQVDCLIQDEGVMQKVDNGELLIVGAYYEISSGIVDFFSEVSKPPSQPDGRPRLPSQGVLSRHLSPRAAK